MLVIVDDRDAVSGAYAVAFSKEGFASTGFRPHDFRDWVGGASKPDLLAVEAFLIGDCEEREALPRLIRERSHAPVIALNDAASLDQTLALFAAGVDDVVRKPVHVREIIARAAAIRRRAEPAQSHTAIGPLRVYFDGRDPETHGAVLPLPRRERRILEYLALNQGRRVSKTQIFNAIYGLFDEHVEEAVVESHVSKLRKKLRERLGRDPIESRRYLGYCLQRA